MNNAKKPRRAGTEDKAADAKKAEAAAAEMAELRRQAEAAWARSEASTATANAAASAESATERAAASAARAQGARAIHDEMTALKERAEASTDKGAPPADPPKPL